MRKFELTTDGYKLALKWLKENDLEYKIQKEQSADCYTVIELANKLYKERYVTSN